MNEQLAETWLINNRVNLYLLDAIAPEHLAAVSASKGRNAGEQFAHLHNVRLMWLKSAAPELLDGQEKIEKPQALDKALLQRSLAASGEAIAAMLRQSDGRVKGFKLHATAFVGYLVAHEAHHHGQIALIMKQNGAPLPKKVGFGLWEWGVR
jgi:uncharacterized damage-inducible protein DinB